MEQFTEPLDKILKNKSNKVCMYVFYVILNACMANSVI